MTSSVFTPGTKVRALGGPIPAGTPGEVVPCEPGRQQCRVGMVHVHWDGDDRSEVLMDPSELEPLS